VERYSREVFRFQYWFSYSTSLIAVVTSSSEESCRPSRQERRAALGGIVEAKVVEQAETISFQNGRVFS
jgi:hypothetical protein